MTDAERAEYDDVVRQLMVKCEQLAAENARLRSSENNAHSVLREVYNDPTASPAVRVKAAGLALSHESAPLKPVEAPLDLVAEPIEPLADVVRRQRARVERMEREAKQIRVLPSGQVLVLDERNDGKGQDDDTAG